MFTTSAPRQLIWRCTRIPSNQFPARMLGKKTNLPDIHPWIVKKPPGRPKRKRKKNPDESNNPYKVLRAGGNVTCGNCHQVGHNIRGCSAAVTGETPWQRRSRIQKAKYSGAYIPNNVTFNIVSYWINLIFDYVVFYDYDTWFAWLQSPPKKRGRPQRNTIIGEVQKQKPSVCFMLYFLLIHETNFVLISFSFFFVFHVI